MKKAVYLLSVLALAGCDEEDLKDLAEGNTKVFYVAGAQVGTNSWEIEPGYYKTLDVLSAAEGISDEDIPFVQDPELTLENAGVEIVGDKSCGRIDRDGSSSICFGEGNCLPDEITMLGLDVFTIDKDDLDSAEAVGFYPTLAADFGGAFASYDFKKVSCSSLDPYDEL